MEVFSVANLFVGNDANEDVVVMTYNMHALGRYMDENREDPDGISDYILRQKADIIALQEYDSIRCKVLQDNISEQYPYHKSMPGYKFMGGNAVFSKFEITSCRYGVLDDRWKGVNELNDNKSERKVNPERFIMLLELNVNGKKIRMANCHFESNNIDERIIHDGDSLKWYQMLAIFHNEIVRSIAVRNAEAKMLNVWVRQSNDDVPTIVCGDLNDFSESQTLRTLQNGIKLKDAWWNGGFGYGATYHGHKLMHFRLDHILYNRNLQLQKVRVAAQDFSDHDALVAGFRLLQ